MRPTDIKTHPTFSELFPVDSKTLGDIAEDMAKNGYDYAQPVVVWEERGVLLDGHTRVLAAESAGIQDIPVVTHSFADEDNAVEYAIKCQKNRRNLSDADLLRWVAEVDRRRLSGERTDLAQDCVRSKRSSTETAAVVGVSARKVEQIRTVQDHAKEDVKQQVASGKMSINKAYKQTQAERKEVDPPKKKPGPLMENPWADVPSLFATHWPRCMEGIIGEHKAGWPNKKGLALVKEQIQKALNYL